MTIANIITLARLVFVPIIIWAMLSDAMLPAFVLFIVAGASDAVDGIIARAFNQQSELGTILDPLADKVMLVSVFIVLTYLDHIPLWLTILVVSRDMLIVVGFVICFMFDKPIDINPLRISKANTVAQIALACFVMGSLALSFENTLINSVLVWVTALLTAISATAYTVQGIRHLAAEAKPIASQTDGNTLDM